jgi:predicted Na+-dependent transporter
MKNQFMSMFRPLRERLVAIETSLTRRENVLSLLIIRFVLMSGIALGFAWTFLHLSP